MDPRTGSLFDELTHEINEDWRHAGRWRENAREEFRFAHGHQWSDDQTKALRNANREWFTFNRVAPALRFISGEEIKNRREVTYLPRTIEDGGATEAFSAGAEYYRDAANVERLETLALQDCLTCGLGYVEDRIDYLDDPDGEVAFEKLDPFEVIPDRNAVLSNLVDARRITRAKRMTLAEAREFLEDSEDDEIGDEEINAGWFLGKDIDVKQGEDRASDKSFEETAQMEPGVNQGSRMVTVVECQYWKREWFVRFSAPAGDGVVEMRRDAFDALADRLGLGGPLAANQRFRRRVYYRAFIGRRVLEHQRSPCQVGFSIKAMTGYRDREDGVWYGLVRDLIDPQKLQNSIITAGAAIFKSAAKGGWLYDKTLAGVDVRDIEAKMARADTAIGFESLHGPQGQPAVIAKPQTALPPALGFLAEATHASFDWVSGMSPEARGQSDAVIPADLGHQRRQTAMTVLQDIFDSIRNYRLLQGRSLLYYMREYLADGRMVRVLGEKGKFVQLMRQPETAKFDVVIDDSPASPNEKERQWPIIERMLMMFGKEPPPELIVEALRYSPLNTSLITKAQEMLGKSKPDPQRAMAEAQQAKRALELTLTRAELDNAQAQLELLKTQAQIRKLLAEAESTEAQAAPEAAADQARADLDEARARALGAGAKAMADADIAGSKAREARARAAAAESRAGIDRAAGVVDLQDRMARAMDGASDRQERRAMRPQPDAAARF